MTPTGRTALITGAAGGIGRATALRFAAEGARLHLVDNDPVGLGETLDAVRAGGAPAATQTVADVTQPEHVAGYVEAALQAHGRIDAFFNNAGIEGPVAPLAEYPLDGYEAVIAVNLTGVFLGLRHVLPVMLEQGSGAIVNTGSLASERGLPGTAVYNATKHAVLGLTRTAAAEVGAAGVRVNAVLPGMIDTRMLRTLAGELGGEVDAGLAFMSQVAPQQRTGRPEEVAAVVTFLCSDDASFVNGVGWPVDGGALATIPNPTPEEVPSS
ncbi:MAG: SDR family oxidoreductase [Solirubrobacteraceae bacterium]|nr:SDR family oxidoreductase [Solirubrobacteraceae bacterium]